MNRVLIAHTPLGRAWWASSLQGEEELSSLYGFRLELKSEESDIDTQSLIGEVCSVACEGNYTAIRYFSGLIINAASKGKAGKHWLYELLIAPKLWYASYRSDFRIFQEHTVQAIADQILQQNAINYEWRLKNDYKTWEYVVQYGETDLAFLLRLLGHEGIYFWFEHTENGEKLILGDHFSVHEPFAGYEDIPYYPPDTSRADEDHFHAWHASRAPGPGKLVQTSYDFKHPSENLQTEFNDPRGHLFDQYEMFAYPGAYTDRKHGQEYAATLLQGLQVGQDTIVLEGSVRGIIPGCSFTLRNHPVEKQNRGYLITKAEYRARNSDYESTDGAQSEEEGAYFHVKVTAMPADRQYRTPREKFKMPRAHGPDTAVVVGPAGKEIHDDQYGRIKVHFHWDRYGQKDGSDSCWIRVASPWAGTSVGTVSIPRIGQEVVIDYEHGDPQRPIVTGCVYNAQQMPPWGFAAAHTQSGFVSRSTPGGGASNFNALRFENAMGREVIWLHAERDLKVDVNNDYDLWVGNDQTETIDCKRTVTVGKGDGLTVNEGGREVIIELGGDKLTVESGGREETIKGGEGDTLTVDGGKRTETFKNGREVTVESGVGDKLIVDGGKRTETFNNAQGVTIKEGRDVFIETGEDTLTVDGGGRTVTVNGGNHHTEVTAGSYSVHATGPITFISDADQNEFNLGNWLGVRPSSRSVNFIGSFSFSTLSASTSVNSFSATAVGVSLAYVGCSYKAIDVSNESIKIVNMSLEVKNNMAARIAKAIANIEFDGIKVIV